jgi:hypothetical protein
VWLFPTSGEADRKFLVRCSFDDPEDKRARERVFVLLELTCTIRTERAGASEDDDRYNGYSTVIPTVFVTPLVQLAALVVYWFLTFAHCTGLKRVDVN